MLGGLFGSRRPTNTENDTEIQYFEAAYNLGYVHSFNLAEFKRPKAALIGSEPQFKLELNLENLDELSLATTALVYPLIC